MHLHKAYMYVEFQQNRVCRTVETVHNNLFAQYRKLHKFPTVNSNFEKKIFLDMHHHKTYMYINFQQNQVKIQVMTVHTSLFAKNRKLHKFATTKNNFKKSTLSDMHHRKTYMHINFQQNWVSRSVKTVHTNSFAKNCKFHKFVTCN